MSSLSMRVILPAILATLIGTNGCGSGAKRTPAIGVAYVGPATLKLRKDIPLQSPTAATLKHGDRLEILQQRRRFFRVRAENGIEGWTDERSLMSQQEIQELKDTAGEARNFPSQGKATTFDLLNVHTDPDRQSPSFFQIKEGDKVDVLAHRVAPRNSKQQRPPILPPKPKKAAVKKKKADPKFPLPPAPAAPKPPANWEAMSKTIIPAEDLVQKPVEPVPMDDWSLVRTASGQTGWVLSRRLYMAIPDEVAQYAEGKRITSYFPLGDEIRDDEGNVHRNYLWTTMNTSAEPYDFDSFRVFIWSVRRHRYETAYIDRKAKGYFPVLLKEVEISTPARYRGAPTVTKYPGFSVCVEKEDGQLWRRNYAFIVNVVRFAGENPCEVRPGETPEQPKAAPTTTVASAAETAGKSLIERIADWRKKLLGK